MAGVSWITVHGRTVRQRGEPANWDAIKLVLNSDFYLKNVDPFDFKWSQAFLPNIHPIMFVIINTCHPAIVFYLFMITDSRRLMIQ